MHFCFPQLPVVSGEMCNQHNLSHKIHTTVSVLFVSQKIERDLKMREANGVITGDRDEPRLVQICNFCICLHVIRTKRFVGYMRPVQTQKQEILGTV